jgi:hypothetical protein
MSSYPANQAQRGPSSFARARWSFDALEFGSLIARCEYDAGRLERELDVREGLTVESVPADLEADDRPSIYAACAADIVLGPFKQIASNFHLGAGDAHSERSQPTRESITANIGET